MKKLLSLPLNLVSVFHEITGYSQQEYFVSSDPVDRKVGSGGGTAWLLDRYEETLPASRKATDEKLILLHAGGQSRRLPAYSSSGKILTPVPCLHNKRGEQIDQNLLSLQLPLYEKIMEAAPACLSTMIVSGDVFIRTTEPLQAIPEADVVCYGLPLSAEKASHHGVFVSSKDNPQSLLYMLQKPDVQTFNRVSSEHLCLVDIGIWLLSPRAVELLRRHSCKAGRVEFYDMYTDFGGALGSQPRLDDEEIAALSVAILPLPGGEFYHFGTTADVFRSMQALQKAVGIPEDKQTTQFVQHADVYNPLGDTNQYVWIENSCVGAHWALSDHHMITGVPENDWQLSLLPGQCVDIVPVSDDKYAVRPYGFDDAFRGSAASDDTLFLGHPFKEWLSARQLEEVDTDGADDLQSMRLFPVVDNLNDAGLVLRWMLNEPWQQGGRMVWTQAQKLSADSLGAQACLPRLFRQRNDFLAQQLPFLEKQHADNRFYHADLQQLSRLFVQNNVAIPAVLPSDAPLMDRISAAMFRSELLISKSEDGQADHEKAFALLREGLTAEALGNRQRPCWKQEESLLVVKRNPVRIDIAGGWTDTPPFSLLEGGRVVNFSLSLDGELPLQAIVAPLPEPVIRVKSVDLHAEEQIETFEQLAAYNKVGSPFSIPKAALALAGFLPRFSAERYDSLRQQLLSFGCGISVTMQSNVPAGSGLGTSSILAATVLDALNEFCSLGWDRSTIGYRTLVLEQLLTTGGGWQDQFGGLFGGVKLLETPVGFQQLPLVTELPDTIYTHPDYAPLHLLYFTGIQRTAKTILAEIVHRMFLNEHHQLALLRQMKEHAADMGNAISAADYAQVGRLMRTTWQQNQQLDSGTNPAAVARLTAHIDDLCYGYKLPGAGGGGFLYMMAKDLEAARRIRTLLTDNAINATARFFDMKLSFDNG